MTEMNLIRQIKMLAMKNKYMKINDAYSKHYAPFESLKEQISLGNTRQYF
jgi:hypothetical protein